MKVGIYNPYLNILGGGERYVITLAEYLSQKGYEVDIFWNDKTIKEKIKKRLGINLNRVNFVEDIFYSRRNLLEKWRITRKYDVIFYLSDGSIPFLFAKNNILHFQVPFKGVEGKSVLNRIKLARFSHIICNSQFTKKHIDREFGVESQVIYPPVAIEDFKPGKKENLILSVGRFTRALHAKKQHILINGFKRMYKADLSGWRLILAGGVLDEDRGYVEELKKQTRGYPIEFETNIHFNKLKRLYGRAKIFWHAAGFGEDENKHPERMEHFGIVVVEAMASGCVPVVIDKGGLPEIVTHRANGLLWDTGSDPARPTRLVEATSQLIKSQDLWQKLSSQAIKDSQRFSKKVFCQKIDEIIKS